MEFPSRVQLDEKFHIYVRPCIILYMLSARFQNQIFLNKSSEDMDMLMLA